MAALSANDLEKGTSFTLRARDLSQVRFMGRKKVHKIIQNLHGWDPFEFEEELKCRTIQDSGFNEIEWNWHNADDVWSAPKHAKPPMFQGWTDTWSSWGCPSPSISAILSSGPPVLEGIPDLLTQRTWQIYAAFSCFSGQKRTDILKESFFFNLWHKSFDLEYFHIGGIDSSWRFKDPIFLDHPPISSTPSITILFPSWHPLSHMKISCR